MNVNLDRFDLYYYVEGLCKYGSAKEAWVFLMDILPQLDNGTRECLLEWCKRDLSCLYDFKEFSFNREGAEEFESFLRLYEIPIADKESFDGIEVNMDLEHLKCYVASKGHGSHLRQDIWEWLIYRYDKFRQEERDAIYYWAKEEFKDFGKYRDCGVDDYKMFLACYNKDNRYIVSYKGKLKGGKPEYGERRCFYHDHTYYINYRTVIKEYKHDGQYLKITSIRKDGQEEKPM